MSHFILAYIDERMCCNPGCFSEGKFMANRAAGCVCLAGSCIANCVEKKKIYIYIILIFFYKVNFYM